MRGLHMCCKHHLPNSISTSLATFSTADSNAFISVLCRHSCIALSKTLIQNKNPQKNRVLTRSLFTTTQKLNTALSLPSLLSIEGSESNYIHKLVKSGSRWQAR
jgi:hypothetical protein